MGELGPDSGPDGLLQFAMFEIPSPTLSAVFWRKVILVPKVILSYGGLKVFFLWTQKKALRKARRWPHLKS